MPSLSVKRNQPTDLLVGSSIFCHSPVTKGSATAVEFAAATNIKSAAIASFTDCTANALLHRRRRKNQVPRIDDPEMVARQCGDFWTVIYPGPPRAVEANPCKFRPLAGNRGLRAAGNPNAGFAVSQPFELILTDEIVPAAALRRLFLCRWRASSAASSASTACWRSPSACISPPNIRGVSIACPPMPMAFIWCTMISSCGCNMRCWARCCSPRSGGDRVRRYAGIELDCGPRRAAHSVRRAVDRRPATRGRNVLTVLRDALARPRYDACLLRHRGRRPGKIAMMRLRAVIVLLAMLLATQLLATQLLATLAVPAQAAERAVVLDIDGAIGPAVADYVVRELHGATPNQVAVVVLRMNTPGGLDTSMRQIISAILASPVPVVAYVAPSGARAASAGTYIAY